MANGKVDIKVVDHDGDGKPDEITIRITLGRAIITVVTAAAGAYGLWVV